MTRIHLFISRSFAVITIIELNQMIDVGFTRIRKYCCNSQDVFERAKNWLRRQ